LKREATALIAYNLW